MRRTKVVIILAMVLALAAFAVPQRIGYQGKLTDPGGVAVEGVVNIGFSIWNAETGGDSLWGELNSVDVTKGLFDVVLGVTNPVDVDFSGARWVQLIVDGELMTPRQPLSAVPSALHANMADYIIGQGSTSGAVTPVVPITSTATPVTLASVSYTSAGPGSGIQLSFAGTFDDKGGQDGAYVEVELVRNPGASEVVISSVSVSIYSPIVHQFQNVAINGHDTPPAGTHTYAVRARVAKEPYTSGRCIDGVLQLAEIKD
ncbi:MAG TPA: hypothetical protein ENN07_04835 [candidate division Zixibacteria bacterium]|nr:hypothetical protein [candidate division Zixibacteria bacterium]